MKSPNIKWFARRVYATIAYATASSAVFLASCAVNPNGPVGPGGSNGSLGSQNMSDYFYHTSAGWTYAFQNVENIYNSDGSVSQTLTGANDTVRTLGFDQIGANGDSLFRYEITYRVSSAYAGSGPLPINYITATHSSKTHGAFVNPGANVAGMSTMEDPPKPISTDTIIAGIAGLVRTRYDDFSNSSSYVWQTDTIWYSEHLDSAFLWEHQGANAGMPIVEERCIFVSDFHNNLKWDYDVINEPNPTTSVMVENADESWAVPAGMWNHTAVMRVKTYEFDDDFSREYKYYGCYAGPIYQYDWWYSTSDGNSFTKQDFTRSLLSLTHN